MLIQSYDGAFAGLCGVRDLDLMAGTVYGATVMTDRPATVLVWDSGVGGLTVYREIRAAMPGASYVYVADDAVFPVGRMPEHELVARVIDVMDRLIPVHRPDIVVIACNTASTVVLPALRARFAVPFVGTVPAIKPAAALTRTGHIAILATPGTVKRDYTRALISSYAATATVELVGATGLAALAEARLQGRPVDEAALLAEIAPCFTERDGRRTDVVALACTHYPLLVDLMRRVAPWPVHWLDPAPAIARRTVALLGPRPAFSEPQASAIFTGGANLTDDLRNALAAQFGLAAISVEPIEAAVH